MLSLRPSTQLPVAHSLGPMTIRVAVTGAAGRMGSTVCQAVEEAEGLELVARLDVGDTISAQTLNGADVAVDFTVPSVTEANVHALIDSGVDVVVGTTGWDEESYARVREHLARPEAAGVAVVTMWPASSTETTSHRRSASSR